MEFIPGNPILVTVLRRSRDLPLEVPHRQSEAASNGPPIAESRDESPVRSGTDEFLVFCAYDVGRPHFSGGVRVNLLRLCANILQRQIRIDGLHRLAE